MAVTNAVAVCPEGKEWSSELSGRPVLMRCFMLCVAASMIAPPAAPDTAMRAHELRLSTPKAFSPSVAASGRYCMYVSLLL